MLVHQLLHDEEPCLPNRVGDFGPMGYPGAPLDEALRVRGVGYKLYVHWLSTLLAMLKIVVLVYQFVVLLTSSTCLIAKWLYSFMFSLQ